MSVDLLHDCFMVHFLIRGFSVIEVASLLLFGTVLAYGWGCCMQAGCAFWLVYTAKTKGFL